MARIRTIPKAVKAIKENDPGTSLTEYLLRKWVKAGTVKSIGGGSFPLVDLDELEKIVLGDALENC